MVKGYQPPPEAPPPVVEAKPAKPKPKKTAAAPRRQAPPPQEMQEAPAAAPATRTQPVQPGCRGLADHAGRAADLAGRRAACADALKS